MSGPGVYRRASLPLTTLVDECRFLLPLLLLLADWCCIVATIAPAAEVVALLPRWRSDRPDNTQLLNIFLRTKTKSFGSLCFLKKLFIFFKFNRIKVFTYCRLVLGVCAGNVFVCARVLVCVCTGKARQLLDGGRLCVKISAPLSISAPSPFPSSCLVLPILRITILVTSRSRRCRARG